MTQYLLTYLLSCNSSCTMSQKCPNVLYSNRSIITKYDTRHITQHTERTTLYPAIWFMSVLRPRILCSELIKKSVLWLVTCELAVPWLIITLFYLYRFVLQSQPVQRRDCFARVLRRLIVDEPVSETLSWTQSIYTDYFTTNCRNSMRPGNRKRRPQSLQRWHDD